MKTRTPCKVMAIGLDGLEPTLAERFMAEGHMPALAKLKERAARFPLDEGAALRTGLAWEHVASGLSPEAGGRWGAVEFDPGSYTAWQGGAEFAPWWAETDLRVVVFDPPFVDLRRARNTQGIVAWGSHSPGTIGIARPASLLAEFTQRFGHYPADEWKYGTPWPSAARSRLMGEALSQALDVRSRAAHWLATERFPKWDLFFAVTGELHGGMEGLWHGMDAEHPLYSHNSAGAAAEALLEIHKAMDRMVGQLVDAAGDAAVLAFNMGGMGPNRSDVQSMVLLPELLYRHAFGKSLLTLPAEWTSEPTKLPMLEEDGTWDTVRSSWVPVPEQAHMPAAAGNLRAAARHLPRPVKNLVSRARRAAAEWRARQSPQRQDLNYMPGYHYHHHWHRMPAFALPSFLDGRIRVNLRGRERDGIVEVSRYEETCKGLEQLLRECRDPRTGQPSVASIERVSTSNPLALPASESDILIVWRDVAAAIEHPRLGIIGPIPLRRTGGHTPHGVAYLAAPGVAPGDRSVRSSFDIVPTIVELLGAKPSTPITGKSLLNGSR
jgi:predicted AlkP superfamily phosphohydrolase/phosphomutase